MNICAPKPAQFTPTCFKIYNGDIDLDKSGKFGKNFATIYPDIIRLYGY